MAESPRGSARSVPDPDGELYDREMERLRKARAASESGGPLKFAGDALSDFQNGPKIPRPNLAQSFIPVIGPAWEAAGDLQDGDYGGAAFNGAMALADLLPVGEVIKGVRMASTGVDVLRLGKSLSADAARKDFRKKGFAKPGQEIHHTAPLKGKSRNAQDVRNHPILLKVLPKEQHRRLTGSWGGQPRYDPGRRLWYGTAGWQKAAPIAAGAYGADSVENLQSRDRSSQDGPRR